MKISSSAFEHGAAIPLLYTCQGDNINPPLTISDVPKAAVSLALIMEDPDVPTSIREDGMWNHWVVWNMSPGTQVQEGSEPDGVHGMTTRNVLTYGGPCPPDREHRYFFKIFALDTMLELPEGSTKEQLLSAMEGHVLEQTELMGTYEKS